MASGLHGLVLRCSCQTPLYQTTGRFFNWFVRFSLIFLEVTKSVIWRQRPYSAQTQATWDFARLEGASAMQLAGTLFGIAYHAAIPAGDWSFAHAAFMRRHLLAHKAGVIDQQYLDETHEDPAQLGRRIAVVAADVARVAEIVSALGSQLLLLLPPP
jgi:hypothetical protein